MKAKIAQSLGPRSAAKTVELLPVNLERVADSAIPTQDGMKNVIGSRPVPGSPAPPLTGSPLGTRREELHAESIV